MTTVLARAVMALATRCLGDSRPEWALAMQGEFEAATEDGNALAFATGCLMAAWRELPAQEHGRFVLANYVLALGVLVPTAALQFACAAGLPDSFFGQWGLRAALAPVGASGPYFEDAHRSAIPTLLMLWLLLGAGHVRLAWVLLERDWARVVRTASWTVAVSATLVVFAVALFLDDAAVGLQATLLAVEVAGISVSYHWHARLFPGVSSGLFAH